MSAVVENIINVPENLCGYIIGTKGQTIRNIQEQHGVKLIFLEEKTLRFFGHNNMFHQPAKPLKIIGSPKGVEAASQEVEKMVEHGMPPPKPVPRGDGFFSFMPQSMSNSNGNSSNGNGN